MKEEQAYDIAQENGLQVVEITEGANGFPKNLTKAVTGFDSFEEAEKLAQETGTEVVELTKMLGWDLWTNEGTRFSPLRLSEDEYFDTYSMDDKEVYLQSFKDDLIYKIQQSDEFDLDKLEDEIAIAREVTDAIDCLENYGDVVIVQDGYYRETKKNVGVGYEEDSKEHVIALF